MTDQDPTQGFTPPPPIDPAPPPAAEPVPAQPPAPAAPPAPPAATTSAAAADATEATAAYAAPPPAPGAPPAPAGVPTFVPPPASSDAVTTTPVSTASGKGRRSPMKWIAALVVVALVAASAVAAGVLLTGASGTPAVLAWAPADSVTYAEVRLDLPGDQQAELAKVLAAFPGFDDQAAFPTKVNEVLDQLVGKATDGKQSYTADIQPWFGGQLSVSIGPVPTSSADVDKARFLALAGVTDATKAGAWVAGVLQESGATSTTETYQGTTITVVTPPAGAGGMADKVSVGYAILGPVLAIGDTASVKAAIDTGGKTGLNTNEQFKTAAATLTGDRLAFAYVDTEALVDAASAMAPAVDGMPAVAVPAIVDDLYAPWMAGAIQAQDGALVVETRQPHVDKLGPADNAASTIPSHVPANTIALVDAQDVGGALKRIKAMIAADPSMADGVQQVDDALKLIGGFDAAVGWIGETGVAVTSTGGTIGGGLVVVPANADDAQRLITQLRGFLTLAGGSAGIKVTDVPYAGTTITVIDLSGISGLQAGGVDVPSGASIAFAATDDVVVVGSGVDFVKGVLDAPNGASLASTDRFKAALGRVDAVNTTLLWLDVAGIHAVAEPMMTGDSASEYEANLKPYLQAFDTVIATSVAGDIDEGTLVVSVAGD